MGTMKLVFDPNQDFQLEAIAAVTDLFEGQDAALPVPQELGPEGLQVQENSLRLNADELLDNLHAVQVRNELQPDMFLDTIREKYGRQAVVRGATGDIRRSGPIAPR